MGLVIAASLGLVSGFVIAWLICRKLPQDKIREINYQRLQEEQELFDKQQQEFEARRRANELELQEIEDKRRTNQQIYEQNILTNNTKIDEILRQVNALQIQKDGLSIDIHHLTSQREEASNNLALVNNNLEQAKLNAQEAAKTFLEQQMALATEQLDRALEQAAQKYRDDEAEYEAIYISTLKDYVATFHQATTQMQQEEAAVRARLAELQNAVNVAVEAAKREEEKREAQNFYRLAIPESDLHEIAQLRAVEPYLRDREALNKVIWKVYYEKPYTDMIGRVLGSGIKTGIYKITCLENQKCYVGQAVDVASRWKQHIKRGLGAEAPTRNKLYPAMVQYGVENFTFELLEECAKDKLDPQEDYWQEFFHAREYGFSIK